MQGGSALVGSEKFILYENGGCFKSKEGKMDCPYDDEKKYLGEWPPNVGLALSGGGTRSASFSIGVLKALHELGILKKVKVISSVSGGSYANYSIFNIRELLLGHIILQGTCTQDGLIERPLLLPFVKKKCCT